MDTTLGQFAVQSALRPAGPNAAAAYELTWIMTLAGVVILSFVMTCVWVAWRRTSGGHAWWIWGGGVLLPIVTLIALTVGSTLTLAAMHRDRDAFVIEVTGHQYWWEVVYDPEGLALRDANELVLPVDRPVTLRLQSADVIHSFWLPSIAGKLDMVPGRINTLTVEASEEGRFRGQCAEFCGLSHPQMAFEAVAVPEAAFAAFLEDLGDEARDADTAQLQRGEAVFVEAGCGACHEVRGIVEGGRLGPDLTRVGARGSLGAGMWRMNVGTLAGWIADVQDMKPGAKMPSFNHLPGPDLRALAQYLATPE